MAQPFVHTLRSLQNDSGSAVSFGLGGLLLATVAWGLWLYYAHITVYEISAKTRIEIAGATFPIHSEAAGKLATVAVTLGQTVRKGDLLFQLDTLVEEQRLRMARARLAAVVPQLEVINVELAAHVASIKAESDTGMAAVKGARARDREARLQAELARSEARRYSQLDGHMISELDVERTVATAKMRQASSEALTLDVQRLLGDRLTRQRTGEAHAAALRRELVTLKGEQQALLASAAELEQLIERRTIRAPSSGRIGELLPLRAGFYVTEGAKLATLMPSDDLILVAEFEPATALGRIKPQQNAKLRLTGFPWLEFGVVPARVSKVSSEVRDGTIRVELDILRDSQSLIPFQHGLPGTVEVEVERVTPAGLILRSLGRRLDGPAL